MLILSGDDLSMSPCMSALSPSLFMFAHTNHHIPTSPSRCRLEEVVFGAEKVCLYLEFLDHDLKSYMDSIHPNRIDPKIIKVVHSLAMLLLVCNRMHANQLQ
jgi:hypothetical protein